MVMSLAAVRSASSGTAWKTASMRGYVKKTVPSGASDGSFLLDFVQADGDSYRFSWSGSTSQFSYLGYVEHGASAAVGMGDPDDTEPFPLDEHLLELMLGPDSWVAGTAAGYDELRLDPSVATGEW